LGNRAPNSLAIELVRKQLLMAGDLSDSEVVAVFRSGVGRFWPNSDVNSSEFRARFPVPECLVNMARLLEEDKVQYWQPWHMEKTPHPEKIGKRISWEAVPNGDEEWSHALVRFTHMVDLAASCKLTNDARFLQIYRRHLQEFFRARVKSSPLWGNRLDSAIRLMNLAKSYDLIRRDEDLLECDHYAILSLMTMEACLLESKLGTRVGNWEFFITTSLLTTSIYLENVLNTTTWKKRASERLNEIIESEILADGSLIEQVPMYHGQCILTILDLLLAQKANSKQPSTELVEIVFKMTEVLAKIMDPQGQLPPIGDSDSFDVDYVLNYAKAVLGPESAGKFTPAKSPVPPGILTFDRLQETGWTVLRWQTEREGTGYLLLDCSGKPARGREGHSHADDLQFIFHTERANVLVDPGRFTYAPIFMSEFNFLPWRIKLRKEFKKLYSTLRPRFRELNRQNWHRYFRHTLRHNTVSRNGENQAGYDDSPNLISRVTAEEPSHKGPLLSCRGVLESAGDYSHTREFLCHAPYFLVIVDKIVAKASANWTASLHLGQGFDAEIKDGVGFIHSSIGDYGYSFAVKEAFGSNINFKVEDDWISPEYNTKIPSKSLRISVPEQASSTLITVIALETQHSGERRATIELNPIRIANSAVTPNFALIYRSPTAEVDAYLRLGEQSLQSGDLSTDAYYSAICRNNQTLSRIGFLQGTYLEIGKNRYTCEKKDGSMYQSVDNAD